MRTKPKFWPLFGQLVILLIGVAFTALDYLFLKTIQAEPANFAVIGFIIYSMLTFVFIWVGSEALRTTEFNSKSVKFLYLGGLISSKSYQIIAVNEGSFTNRTGTYSSIVFELENDSTKQITSFNTKNFESIKSYLLKNFPTQHDLKVGYFNGFSISFIIFMALFIIWMLISKLFNIL